MSHVTSKNDGLLKEIKHEEPTDKALFGILKYQNYEVGKYLKHTKVMIN